MDDCIQISLLDDFIFCPASIYFRNLYGGIDTRTIHTTDQTLGSACHASIAEGRYSSHLHVLQDIYVYSETYNLVGKIDIYDSNKKMLTERKRQIKQIYDGYIFQVYGQYFGLTEMGFPVREIRLYSVIDNLVYPVSLPHQDGAMLKRFEQTIEAIKTFDLNKFTQPNASKCKRCIYSSVCDRGEQS